MSDEPTTIVIERFKLLPSPVRAYVYAWKWTYNYRVNNGPECQYGPGLVDLRSMLKRKFPGAQIVETWKESQP